MEEIVNPEVSKPKLPKYLTTVTTFSKVLAMILFITLPLLGFFLGMKYKEGITVKTDSINLTATTKPSSPFHLDDTSLIKKAFLSFREGFECLQNQGSSFLISKNNGTYAVGTAGCVGSSGFEWGAIKINSQWTIYFADQQSPNCIAVENSNYVFPIDFVPKCYQGLGNEVIRK